MSGVWGTITDSDWTDDDARVVCRKLGHFKTGTLLWLLVFDMSQYQNKIKATCIVFDDDVCSNYVT